nr:T9SS type A sorting domain-containing protein [Candidatus Cloacimonadota bacterium]
GRVIDVFPNPCQNYVCFKAGKTESAQVSIKIYNLKGQLINTLYVPARDQVVWDLKDRHGKRVESGLYLYRIYESGRHTGTNKLIVIG